MQGNFEDRWKGDWCTTYSWTILSWRSRSTCRTLFSLERKDHRKWGSTKREMTRCQVVFTLSSKRGWNRIWLIILQEIWTFEGRFEEESPQAWSLHLRVKQKLLIFTLKNCDMGQKFRNYRETMPLIYSRHGSPQLACTYIVALYKD